jgi:hypothetical protein
MWLYQGFHCSPDRQVSGCPVLHPSQLSSYIKDFIVPLIDKYLAVLCCTLTLSQLSFLILSMYSSIYEKTSNTNDNTIMFTSRLQSWNF